MAETRFLGDAINDGDVDRVTDLLESDGVDLNHGDERSNYETPLMRLCHSELAEEDAAAILELMLLKCPDVNIVDREGRTALCHACMSGQTYFVRRLANTQGSDPNIADYYGNTALMFGAYYGDLLIVQELVYSFHQLDILKGNHEGINAIAIAEQNGFYDISILLQKHTTVETCAETSNDVNNIGHKAMKFRRKKLKHALGPLVVQNRLQSSKSVDYIQYYRQNSEEPSNDVSTRQYSYSAAGTHTAAYNNNYDVPKHGYNQVTRYQEQYSVEDESSSEEDEAEPNDSAYNYEDDYDDQGYEDGVYPPRQRRSSISLPDLRSNSGALVAAGTPHSCGEDGSFCDSGYDTRSSQFALTREELCLPDLPEADVPSSTDEEGTDRSNHTPLTPRGRRDSLSLPDLRGAKRCLVGATAAATSSSPRLLPKALPHPSVYQFRQQEDDMALQSLPNSARDDELSDDVFEGKETPPIASEGLKLPELGQSNKVMDTPRGVNTSVMSSRRAVVNKVASTPRGVTNRVVTQTTTKELRGPNRTVNKVVSTQRTVTDNINKKLTKNGQKVSSVHKLISPQV